MWTDVLSAYCFVKENLPVAWLRSNFSVCSCCGSLYITSFSNFPRGNLLVEFKLSWFSVRNHTFSQDNASTSNVGLGTTHGNSFVFFYHLWSKKQRKNFHMISMIFVVWCLFFNNKHLFIIALSLFTRYCNTLVDTILH